MKEKQMTVVLTNRYPVEINPSEWPLIASASEEDRHGAQVGNQPNQEDTWTLKVRRHVDGRCLVYGVYTYDTAYEGGKDVRVAHGVLLTASEDNDIVQSIVAVGNSMFHAVNRTDRPGVVFSTLVDQCIGDLPAEKI